MKTKMKTTLLFCLFPLLLFLVAHADASGETEFKLKCQEKPVEVHVGENVTLNCKSEPQLDLMEEKITWKVNSTIVLNFKDRKRSPYQDEQFKGRVHNVSDWKVSEGKLSVKISSLNENDAGVYTCSVLNGPKCTVTLTVKKGDEQTPGARGDNTPPPPPSGGLSTGAIIGIVVGAVVLVFAAFAAWLIYRKRKSLPSCIGTQKGGERDGEELKRGRYQKGRTESPTGE